MASSNRSTRDPHRRIVLIVDSDVRSQRLARLNLEPLGYQTIATSTAEEALNLIETQEPDLVISEVSLSDGDGFQLCPQIRAKSMVPIIFVSTRGELGDRLRGFAAGADDYLTKPYDPDELAARMGAVLRRANATAHPAERVFHSGPLAIDFAQRRVTMHDKEVSLSRTEYRLLEYLALNAGRTLIADAVLTHVWGPEYVRDVASLHLYMSRLRRKLQEDAHNPRFILTKPGIGYMMRVNPDVESHLGASGDALRQRWSQSR